MPYIILIFLVFLAVLLGMISVQLLRVEKIVRELAERIEENALRKIE